ncbi:unnamed protein product [Heligmosomoides polygyrus]|uniref:DUF5641 domain-containing protein n=1 Tax=Heligmosomoides polygyrus TaxID=6339 RepID=A0A183FTJ9_HELPZ|nr:unnamed protein product [Heligmosomoides polygyrus]
MHHLDNIIVSREKYEDSTTLCHRDSNAGVSEVVTHATTVPIQSADDVEETTTKCYARIDHTEANLPRIEIAPGRARSEPAATIGIAPRGIATHRGAHLKIGISREVQREKDPVHVQQKVYIFEDRDPLHESASEPRTTTATIVAQLETGDVRPVALSRNMKYGFSNGSPESPHTIVAPLHDDDEDVIKRLWSLESIGIMEDHHQNADSELDDHILAKFRRTAFINGFLYVQFPWKDSHPKLRDNKQLAFCRLVNQYQKLRKSPAAWAQYAKAIEDHMAAGFVEEAREYVFDDHRKSVGRSLLPLETLQTTVVEFEAIINSRPITPFRESDTFAHTLKPADFISPEVNIQVPPIPQIPQDFFDSSHKLAAWIKESLQVLDRFWDLWRSDYLAALKERQQLRIRQPRSSNITPGVGDVVIMGDNNTPRGLWPLAVITKLNYAPDKVARSAVVRTTNGKFLTRSITQLYPLELAAPQALEPNDNDTSKEKPALEQKRVQPLRAAKAAHRFITTNISINSPHLLSDGVDLLISRIH